MDPYLVHYTGRIAVKYAAGNALKSVTNALLGLAGLEEPVGLDGGAPAAGGSDMDRWVIFSVRGWTPDTVFGALAAPGPAALDIADRVTRIANAPGLAVIEPEVVFRAAFDPREAYPEPTAVTTLSSEWDWHHKRTGVARVDERGAGVLIGHLDTGIDRTVARHLLGDRLIEGADYDDGSDIQEHFDIPRIPPWHGTGTLGLLAADAADGYRGVAPGARVLSARVSPSVVLIRNTALAYGIEDLTRRGCSVISISMGGAASPLWADAVNHAWRQGTLVCAAAGNNLRLTPHCVGYPARFERVFCVAGVTYEGSPYSEYEGPMRGNYGRQVDICAPTPDVTWAQPDRQGGVEYVPRGGTSTATPQVAGVAALWFGKWAELLSTPAFRGQNSWKRVENCRRALVGGARLLPNQTGHDPRLGFGCLDAEATLDQRWQPVTNVPPVGPAAVPRPWWRSLNPCAED
ncbi:MAG: S8/S53 family peptidase [Pseudomonadota bacterium]|nr:S8/S53 family peptidase [Pseudomonadota bacterium]